MYTLDVTAATDFPSLCVKDISIASFPSHDFIDLLKNFLPLSIHISFGLWFDLSKIFWKAVVIVIPFLSFKVITMLYAYIL